jgi:hypothetical protein
MTASERSDRRDFLRLSVRTAFALAGISLLRPYKASRLVIIAMSGPGDTRRSASRALGVTMGVEEAARSAQLFGGDVRLERIAAAEKLKRRLASDERSGVPEQFGIVGGEATDECLALASVAADAAAIYMNTLCASDDLRGQSCSRNTFHVAPSERMLADARATGADAKRVTAWDASLQSFGADTLNQRFRLRFDRAMDGDAWAGWFAVKALAEGTLRASHPSSAALIDFLESERGAIDGHKGRPLSFRPWDHQLRQPLYLYSSAQPTPMEVPRPAGERAADSRDILDMLGTRRADSVCRFRE